MTALDPGDRAYADEQEHAAGSDLGEEQRAATAAAAHEASEGQYGAPIEGEVGLDVDAPAPPGCRHPEPARRLYDGQQVCSDCWEVLDEATPAPAIIPRDRPGSIDPTMRSSDGSRPVGLRHVEYDPDQQYPNRPYTPEQVELEITRILAQIESGAGFLTTKEEERSAAKLEYELAYARALLQSTRRSAEQRDAEAMLACEEQYERWQLLELTCRTGAAGMHNLRSMLSGFQSVLRSTNTLLGNYR